MEEKKSIVINYDKVSFHQFKKAAEILSPDYDSQLLFTSPVIQDNVNKKSSSNEIPKHEEEHMSASLSKTELEALLRVNKAEVDVVAATMKKDMAEWREQQNTQLANINSAIQSLSAKVDGKIDSVEGKIDGLKSSISTTQWTTSIGLALVTIIMSAVVLASSWIISSKGATSLSQPTEIHSQQAEPSKK
ncbi:hypothetical protein XBO1_2160004 [Xenorhabdus bovienii str. oregonense]|uniref:Uncharacterized protein n=1 Tax=Xenorhabdus bovienii str. oregonense TaxID=1398202 RepID=A0A077P5W4_XENBV|nr:hypothetical protein [Xenorhabdus bovienii]CDH06179.1 hypothetical protein XBO1_2160004 [Xenorhabdus bovienii str. oregonense]